jgi:hypothetical protein
MILEIHMDALYQKVLDLNEKHDNTVLRLPSIAEMKDSPSLAGDALFKYSEDLEKFQLPFYRGRYAELKKIFWEFYSTFLKQQTMKQKLADIHLCAAMLRNDLEHEYGFSGDIERRIDHIAKLSEE